MAENTPDIRFGSFVEDWKRSKIGDVITEKKRPVVLDDNTTYQLITVKRRNEGVVSRGFLKGKQILVKNYFELKAKDYVISKRQVVHGANSIVPEKLDGAIVSNEYLVAIANDDITTEFLTLISKLPDMYKKFFVSSYGIDIEKLVFDVDDWKKRELSIPDTDEQKKITAFFKDFDELCSAEQQKYDKLVNFKKSMLNKMFPKGGSKVPEVRFKRFSDEWEKRKLDEISKVTMGQSPQGKNYTNNPTDHILVQGNADIKNGRVVPRVWTTQITKTACRNDLLISVRAPVGEVGKTDFNIVIGRGVAAIKGNELIFQSLLRMNEIGFWKQFSCGSTFESINSDVLKSAEFFIPCDEKEQSKVGDIFKNLDILITLQNKKLQKLSNI